MPSTPVVRCQPRKMSLAGLHQVLPGDNALALVGVSAAAGVVGEHRGLGLFGLEEQWFLAVVGLQQQDPGAGADAADPDDLAGDLDQLELLHEVPAVGLQGARVLVEEVGELDVDRLGLQVTEELFDRHDQRRVADDPSLSVDDGGELAQRLHAVSGASLGHRLLGLLRRFLAELRIELVDGVWSMSRWAYQTPSIGMFGELHASRCGRPRRRRGWPCGAPSAVKPLSRPATATLAANRLTSHSNGPGRVSSKSLRSKTSRRSGEAKAPKLARCASPHSWTSKPRRRRGGQVGGHRKRCTAVVGERRDEHPPVPDRHQLRDPSLGLLQQQADRVPVRRGVEHPMRGQGCLGAGCFALGASLGSSHLLDRHLRSPSLVSNPSDLQRDGSRSGAGAATYGSAPAARHSDLPVRRCIDRLIQNSACGARERWAHEHRGHHADGCTCIRTQPRTHWTLVNAHSPGGDLPLQS